MRRITFVNHATVLLEFDGFSLLTDPVYSFSISFFLPRFQQPGIPFHLLPSVDTILISHNHYDHLNMKTLRRLGHTHDSTILLPRGDGRYGRRSGFSNVKELEWWETFELHGTKITFVPAKHFSGRMGWDRNRSLYGGYVIEREGATVYFAGDTGYGGLFADLADRFHIDVALLPIGAYKPYNWFKDIHLNPRTAVQAFLDSKAKHMVPIHWGTFKISDEPLKEPPELLRKEMEERGLEGRIHILKNGERLEF